jgi:hypothetical protein
MKDVMAVVDDEVGKLKSKLVAKDKMNAELSQNIDSMK